MPNEPGFSPAFAAGYRLGKFTIQRFIARGGMGEVYKAWDNDLNRPVALKTLLISQPGAYTGDPQFRNRFRQEARTISHIEHPNIVRVLELGEHDNGLPFIVMPFLEGEDLQKRLSRAAGKPLSTEEAVAILLGACRGVDMCHRAGIVHRDLKPGNIFLTQDQETGRPLVKVLDFGVAKPRTQDQDDLTADGLVLGTPSFMPPEQARGFSVDARSDQYALGALLYSCLTLRKPYDYVEAGLTSREERNRAVMRALREGQSFPPPRRYVPDIPQPLEAAILRAMSADPDDRFPSVFDFSRELRAFAAEDVSHDYRSYYDATPRAISVPQMSLANVSAADAIRGIRDARALVPLFADQASGTEPATTKSLRKPAGPDEPTDLSSPRPAAPPAKDQGTAKLDPSVEAVVLAASRPVQALPEDSTSLAPSQASATSPDRAPIRARGPVLFALAGAGVLAGVLVLHHRLTPRVTSNGFPPSTSPTDPAATIAAAPARPAQPPSLPTVPPDVHALPDTAAVPKSDEAPAPRKAPRVLRDKAGHRIVLDKHGRRWAVDSSGQRLFQVDAAGNPAPALGD